MGYVFISYSSKDKYKADEIRYVFKLNGIETWMAPYDVPSETKYAAAITKAIMNCGCFCLLLSKSSQESDPVDSEVNIAKDARKTFVVVQLENMVINDAFRYYIGNQHIEKLFDIRGDSPAMKKIILAVKNATSQSDEDFYKLLGDIIRKDSRSENASPKTTHFKSVESKGAKSNKTQTTHSLDEEFYELLGDIIRKG